MTPWMARASSLALAATTLVAARADVGRLDPTPPVQDALPNDLRAVLDTGWLLQDVAGDGTIDHVATFVVLDAEPRVEETAAAAEVAARLGFETLSLDPGLARLVQGPTAFDRPVIVVGGALASLELTGALPVPADRGLAPGEGSVSFVPPGPAAPRGGVAIVGYDATGLFRAASYFAGRYPSVWDPGRPLVWSDVAARLETFFETRDLEASVRLQRLVVGEQPGVTRVDALVTLPDTAALREARSAVRDTEPAAEGRGDAAAPADAPPPDSAAADSASAEPTALDDLVFAGLHRIDVHLTAEGAETVIVPVLPPSPTTVPRGPAWRPPPESGFDLPGLYAVGGLYRDSNRDLVPDQTAAWIALADGAAPAAVVDLAARVGLETAGITLPLVRIPGESDALGEHGTPVVVGRGSYAARNLRTRGRLPDVPTGEGAGAVHVVPDAFAGRTAVIVEGSDAGGLQAALEWTARRAPWVWRPGKGELELSEVATDARRFLQARDAAGQVALALYKLGAWSERAAASSAPPSRLEVELAAERVPDGLQAAMERAVRAHLPEVELDIETFPTGFGVGDTVFALDFEFPWEVDVAREAVGSALERIDAGAPVRVEVRVSEPLEVRRALKVEIEADLAARGVPSASADVRVLSAYKQGFSWIEDVVIPRLSGLPVASVAIEYRTLEDSDEVRWQTVASATRWLQELYPIDAVMARELAIPDSAIVFRPHRREGPVYALVARDASGLVVFEDSFSPRYVVRPFFDLFPEYEQVRVTTGWVTVARGEDVLVDRRVVTDPEAFWDVLQTDVYRRMIDYVMDTQDGDPSPANAPYFDEFRVDLALSEPNRRIDVDEEVVSSLEALHEDLYFETLTLFDLIGDRYGVGGLSFPGRVLPHIDPTGAGGPGRARVVLTGKQQGTPALEARFHAPGGGVDAKRYRLTPLAVDPPRLLGVGVKRGNEGLEHVRVDVTVRDSVDRVEELEARASEAQIDRTFPSVQLVEGMLEALAELRSGGLFSETLSWPTIGRLDVRFHVEDDSTWTRTASLTRTASPSAPVHAKLIAEGWTWAGERLVQWNTPIPPRENDSILARLARFPEADVYRIARSYLGQPIWAADFLPPYPGRLRSQAKLNALRPTLLISGRQHANEVSSTSHILRLGELLVTDSTYRNLLDRVNVVLHPITNADGARLAVEMQQTNPDFMLHAGYLGALGVDATSGEQSEDPIYPESQARRRLRETWLPDVYVNMHGYPSHEWVQYFAGYSAWVRSRRGGQRSWWAPRGWFVPGFSWVDDDENPDFRTAQFALLDSVAAAITGAADVEAMNRRLYARYRKYGVQDREGFREYFHRGILVYLALRGRPSIGQGVYSPRITYFSTTTEAPDETARGPWLDLVASAGLAHSSALLRYLANGTNTVAREAEGHDGAVTRSVHRTKPVLPGTDTGRPDEAR